MKTHDVFGIQPTISHYSYVDRGSLDQTLRKLVQRQQTHIAIRGASKAGKSWLRQQVLEDPIIVQCRLSYSTADIYRDALARLDIAIESERSTSNTNKIRISGAGEVGLKLLAKVSGGGEAAKEDLFQVKEKVIGKDLNDLEYIASLIRASNRVLVIEDFHYLSEEEQRRFAFDLKTLWDYKTFVVVIGVWISENMLITLNPDLSDRIEELSVTWQPTELRSVLDRGCNALNLKMSSAVTEKLASISYGSVGLLQKLALRFVDEELGIEESVNGTAPTVIDNTEKVDDAAMHVAEQLNQLYQAFAKRVSEGIRRRKNATGIYAHAMAAIMAADDEPLSNGLSAKTVFEVSSAKQPRIKYGNLKTALSKFADLQVDEERRGLVLAYDAQDEKVFVVDKQLLLYRAYCTVKWPWDEIIAELETADDAYGQE